MKKEEMVKLLGYLGVAYGKEFTQQECEVYYDFFKDYNYSILQAAIKNTIKTSKYMPKIADLIEACDKSKEDNKVEIIELMKQQGYFKAPSEYDKALAFVKKGIIPEWLKSDMKEAWQKYNMLQIETNQKLIGG